MILSDSRFHIKEIIVLYFLTEPEVVPSNFEIDPEAPFSYESIGLRWDPVDTSAEAMQGKFNGYKVCTPRMIMKRKFIQ